jgi:hypothetical protein
LPLAKTIDICVLPGLNDQGEVQWRYSGDVSVWNEGVVDTQNLTIIDTIQKKGSGSTWVDKYSAVLAPPGVIPAGTTLATATVFPYSFDATKLTGDIRNVATITITNHSGSLGTPKGPQPKATWTGGAPQPCQIQVGCTYTQGYWGNKPGVVWPTPYDRSATFFSGPLTWQGVLDAPAAGNGYIILGKQYIAAVLNKANNAPVPSGVQTTIDLAFAWYSNPVNTLASCSAGGTCGLQKTWGGTLDAYNNGLYPGGPSHCGDENQSAQSSLRQSTRQ